MRLDRHPSSEALLGHSGVAVRTLAFGLLLALLAGCASLTRPWEPPEVTLAGLRVKELGLAQQTLILTLAVHNPNDRTLPIKGLTYRLKLEGNEIAQGSSALDRQIPAFGEALADVEVTGSLLTLAQQLPALALKDRPLDWTLTGTATIAEGLLTLPYRYSGQVDPRELLARGEAALRVRRPPAQ
jgi:LEA14-like dessication related protein